MACAKSFALIVTGANLLCAKGWDSIRHCLDGENNRRQNGCEVKVLGNGVTVAQAPLERFV
jgi:hypothetical protein